MRIRWTSLNWYAGANSWSAPIGRSIAGRESVARRTQRWFLGRSLPNCGDWGAFLRCGSGCQTPHVEPSLEDPMSRGDGLARQLQLMQMLEHRQEIVVPEVAAELGYTVRTVYRDLQVL